MALFDRVAVPMLLLVGVALTWALFGQSGRAALAHPGDGSLGLLVGFDLVVGYQISWSLMFADYTRYQRSEGMASRSAFFGLAISSAWLMVLGAGAGLAGGGNDPTEMVLSVGLPAAALLLMALSTVTTNFVNLFLSSLAIKNLWPGAPDRRTVLAVGAIGTAFGLVSSQLLDRYAGFMGWIGTTLLPIVAVTVVHFFWLKRTDEGEQEAAWRPAAIVAWVAGVGTYQALTHLPWQFGATLPTLLVTALVYALLARR
jgi:purine-cytosine permease-like protein